MHVCHGDWLEMEVATGDGLLPMLPQLHWGILPPFLSNQILPLALWWKYWWPMVIDDMGDDISVGCALWIHVGFIWGLFVVGKNNRGCEVDGSPCWALLIFGLRMAAPAMCWCSPLAPPCRSSSVSPPPGVWPGRPGLRPPAHGLLGSRIPLTLTPSSSTDI